MNEADAAQLAQKVIDAFPRSPKKYLWIEQLKELGNVGWAFSALARCQHAIDGDRVSIARFLAEYRVIEQREQRVREQQQHERLTGGPPISLNERKYNLAKLARAGSREAAEELRNLTHPPKWMPPGRSS